ncbi:restriction endonuclease subunit S [Treponema sp.]|uniref:restriction endonuclease subunit S n=1 Tax=Treponema sp. TaxID=166 RepID=UPI002A7F8D99|nr:restriction endonuclease subunit S [Treponema sp.]MDY4132208.1 restriction endonuclease subunit S [Treponema sp.]
MNRCKVQEIAELITKGTTPTTLGFSYIDEGINFVKIESIDANGKFDKTKFAHISEECHVSLKRSKLQKNDILFSIAGAIGRTAIVSEDILPANTNQALAIIRLKKNNNDLNFIRYQLSSASVIKQTEKQKQGVAQLNLSLKDIGNLEINVPSLPEQKKIASHLDTIQSAIDNKKQQLQQLDELVKSKFVEMFGETPIESGKWKVETLGSKSELITKGASPRWQGVEYQSEGTLFVTSENVREGYVDLTKSKYLPDEINEILPRSILRKNDVLINIVGASIGRAAIYEFEKKANINQAVALVRLNSSDLDRTFLLIYLNSELAMKLYQSMIKGGARDNLSLKNISDLSIPVPPIELQNTFAEYVQKIDSAKSIIKTQLNDLNELLESKMDFYFGE